MIPWQNKLDKSYNIKYLVSFVLFVGIFQVKCTIITQIKIQKKSSGDTSELLKLSTSEAVISFSTQHQ